MRKDYELGMTFHEWQVYDAMQAAFEVGEDRLAAELADLHVMIRACQPGWRVSYEAYLPDIERLMLFE